MKKKKKQKKKKKREREVKINKIVMHEPCTQTYTYQKHENYIIINNSIRKQRKKNYSNGGLNMILLLMRKNYIAHKFNKHSIGFL